MATPETGKSELDIDALMDAPVAEPGDAHEAPIAVESFGVPGPLLLTPRRRDTARGNFTETYNASDFADAVGRDVRFVQDNQWVMHKRGVLRGMHFQYPPFAQGKLVRVVAGEVLDVVVDIRTGGPTFGQHVKTTLSAKDGNQLWIPEGFAHGFVTKRANTVVMIKTTALYAPQAEGVLKWDDPLLYIDWEIRSPELSDRDARAPGLGDLVTPFALNPPQRV